MQTADAGHNDRNSELCSDLLWNVLPINDLVPDCAKELFSRLGQEHQLLNALGLSFAFEPGDERVPKSSPLITGDDNQ